MRQTNVGLMFWAEAEDGLALVHVAEALRRDIEAALGAPFELQAAKAGDFTPRDVLAASFLLPVLGPGFFEDPACVLLVRAALDPSNPPSGVIVVPVTVGRPKRRPLPSEADGVRRMLAFLVPGLLTSRWPRVHEGRSEGFRRRQIAARIAAAVRDLVVPTVPTDPPPAPDAPAPRGPFPISHVISPRRARPAEAVPVPVPVTLDLAYIPAGTFWMGSPAGVGEDHERPRHRLRITAPFQMGVTPVTQAQWGRVIALAGARGLNLGELADRKAHFPAPDRPMDSVNWHDARTWCNLLSALEGFDPAYTDAPFNPHATGYRLPTEAEWEYACRAGTTTRWSFGDDEQRLGDHAWFGEGNDGETHPVAAKLRNPWDLHDLHGNVWEWCEDAWDGSAPYPANSAKILTTDPLGDRGDRRVMRGGSCWGTAVRCRSAYRDWVHPGSRYQVRGFRVVRSLAPRADP